MTGAGPILGLLVLVPIAAAVIPVLSADRFPNMGWRISTMTLAILAACAVLISVIGTPGPRIRYEVGTIPAAYGIELVWDGISGMLVAVTLLVILGATVHTRRAEPRSNRFHAGLLLLTGGVIGILLAGDLFNLYVFLELTAIATYALIATADHRRSTYAAYKYLLLGTFGASVYLLGVAYVFVATGTLNMARLATAVASVGYADPVIIASFVFISVGLAIKIALVPFHTWLPDAHATAPDAISAVISGLLPAIAVYALARILFTVYGIEFLQANPILLQTILGAGVLSVLAGSVFALLQTKLKLLLAYSTIAHVGLAVIGLGIANERAMFGALYHLVGHGIMKAALFLAVGLIALGYGATTLADYEGLGQRSPVLAGAIAGLALGLIGLPPTIGFTGKWYLALGAIEAGSWLIAAIVIGSTLLTLAYMAPIIDRLFFGQRADPIPDRSAVPRDSLLVVILAVAIAVGLGIVTVWIEGLLEPSIMELLQ